ncbi:MAG: hypothetical protein WCP85_27385 [Mariniphaga sp.]
MFEHLARLGKLEEGGFFSILSRSPDILKLRISMRLVGLQTLVIVGKNKHSFS